MRRLVCLLSILVAVFAPAGAAAHDGGEALIQVPIEHVMPGEPFGVIAADFDPRSSVEISLIDGDRVLPLETVVAQDDGHFETDVSLPADHPHGSFELVAFSEFGVRASTSVVVGPPTGLPGPPDPASEADGLPLDPSVVVLGVLVGGLAAGLLYLLLRPAARRGRSRRGR